MGAGGRGTKTTEVSSGLSRGKHTLTHIYTHKRQHKDESDVHFTSHHITQTQTHDQTQHHLSKHSVDNNDQLADLPNILILLKADFNQITKHDNSVVPTVQPDVHINKYAFF